MNNKLNKKEAADAPSEEYDVLPDDLLRDIARLKGHAPQKGIPVATSILYPVSAARDAEERRKEEEMLANPTPGQFIPGHGIFLCKYAPKDRNGRSLGKIFNVYAAPRDLMNDDDRRIQRTYANTVKYLSKLRNWYHHDGAAYRNDTELYTALKNGSYKGEWIIPPREVLSGKDVDGNAVQSGNILKHINAGELKATFWLAYSDAGYPDWYWSCTEYRDNPSYVHSARLLNGHDRRDDKGINRLSCRPVRLELLP